VFAIGGASKYIEYTPPNTVAIYGPLKTENIGIEK